MQTVNPNPVDFATRGFGDLGAIPRFDRDFFFGPVNYGDPVVPFQRYSTRWAAFVATSGVRIAKITPGFTASNSDGSLSGLYNTPGFQTDHLGAAFDKNGEISIARQVTDSTWEIRKFVLGVPTTFGPFAGRTPLPWLTALAVGTAIDQEVAVFYLRDSGSNLYCRLEREGYSVEHWMAAGLPIAVGRLTKLDFDQAQARLFLWGMSENSTRATTRQVLIRSAMYPPFPFLVEDGFSLTAAGLAGVYEPAVVTAPGQSDSALDLTGSLSGDYFDAIEAVSELDVSTLDLTLTLDGDYEEVVLVASESDASLVLSDPVLSGDYEEIILPAGTVTDATLEQANGLSGVYEAV